MQDLTTWAEDEQAIELAALRGKNSLGLSGPFPARVDSAAKISVGLDEQTSNFMFAVLLAIVAVLMLLRGRRAVAAEPLA